MAIIGDALRQAFMPKHEYERLREEDRAWGKLQRPLLTAFVAGICLVVVVCTIITLNIVFPADPARRPFCGDRALQPLPINVKGGGEGDSDLLHGAFYLTDQETVDYFWMVVFVPSMVIFLLTAVYLIAGITVAYSAPTRHGCLKVVENNYCASKRGGVRCLAILNAVFAIVFGLLAMFLGSSLLTLGNSCSLPLFWCYEFASWGLVILYGGTAFFLRRRAAVILDEADFSGQNLGLEMLEANPVEVTPEVERRVSEGFKAWMGSSLLSSDEEDEPDSYQEVSQLTRTNSNRETIWWRDRTPSNQTGWEYVHYCPLGVPLQGCCGPPSTPLCPTSTMTTSSTSIVRCGSATSTPSHPHSQAEDRLLGTSASFRLARHRQYAASEPVALGHGQ